MNISIALLTAVILHLTLLTFSVDLKKYYPLMRLIVPIHFISILLCLITTIAYLFEKELGLIQLDICNRSICFSDMPKYLLTISLIITILVIRKSWNIVLAFFDEISKNE